MCEMHSDDGNGSLRVRFLFAKQLCNGRDSTHCLTLQLVVVCLKESRCSSHTYAYKTILFLDDCYTWVTVNTTLMKSFLWSHNVVVHQGSVLSSMINQSLCLHQDLYCSERLSSLEFFQTNVRFFSAVTHPYSLQTKNQHFASLPPILW